MAPAVIAVAAAVGESAIGAMIAGTSISAAIGALSWTSLFIKAAVAEGLSLVQESLARSNTPQQSPVSADTSSRKQLIRASAEPRRAIYGETRTSGVLMYGANGTDANYVHLVIALAGHACQSIGNTYFGTEVAGDLDADGNVITGRFAGYVRIRKYLGSETQEPDPDLGIECPEWGAKYRPGKGITYVYLRIKRSRDVWPTGLPTPMFDVQGKNDILDVRTGLTGYTTNAALISLDYILWKHGFNSALDEVNQTTWITAANVSDEVVDIPGGGTQPRYTINGSFTLDAQRAEILDEMRCAMAGAALYSMGVWEGYAGAASSPVIDLSEKHLRGPYKVHPRAADDQVYNAVKGTYIETTQWTETDFPAITNPLYEAQDGGERIYKDVKLPFTTDPYMAQRISKIDLERHRQPIVVEYPARMIGMKVKVWEVLRLSIAKQGWVNKQFRVIDKKISLFGGADLVLEEYTPAIYTMLVSEMVTVDPAPDTSLANPCVVETPSGLVLSSGTAELLQMGDGTIVSRLKVVWNAPVDAGVREAQIQYKKSADAAWIDAAPVRGAIGPTWITPVQDGTAYDVRVRFENGIGVRSVWSPVVTHTVVGKSEPPADVPWFYINGNSLSWGTVLGADIAGYMLRWQPGNNHSWGDANTLIDGLVQVSPLSMTTRPSGLATLLIKAVDTSCNESVNAAAIVTDLGDPLVANVIATTDFHALGFMGTVANASVELATGDLVATATASPQMWSPNDQTALWAAPSDPMWTAATYVGMSYTCSISVAAADAGSQLTLDAAISAASYLVEYRRDGAAPLWTDGLNPMWTGDADPMWSQEAWKVWAGSLAEPLPYQFRVTTTFGTVQGRISRLKANLDVADIVERLNNVAISAAGTRLPITKTYRVIKNVNLTLQHNGGTAMSAKWLDKSASGPLTGCFDSTNALTTGVVDATIQGY